MIFRKKSETITNTWENMTKEYYESLEMMNDEKLKVLKITQ